MGLRNSWVLARYLAILHDKGSSQVPTAATQFYQQNSIGTKKARRILADEGVSEKTVSLIKTIYRGHPAVLEVDQRHYMKRTFRSFSLTKSLTFESKEWAYTVQLTVASDHRGDMSALIDESWPGVLRSFGD
jgi:hypothetical protein